MRTNERPTLRGVMRWAVSRAWLIALAVVAGIALAAPVLSEAGWRAISGYRQEGPDRIEFELQVRGLEAVLVERLDGAVVYRASCHGRTLVEEHGNPPYRIDRETDSAEECFRWATGSLLGYAHLRGLAEHARAVARPVPALELSGFPPGSDWSLVLLDSTTDLPLKTVATGGAVVEWHYDVAGDATGPADAGAVAAGKPDEVYESIAREDAWVTLGLASASAIPASIHDLEFETAFSYLGGELQSPRTYVIWTSGDNRQVQLIVTPGLLPPDTPTLEDLGAGAVVLNVQDDGSHWQILASDRDLLRAATLAIRPDLAPAVR